MSGMDPELAAALRALTRLDRDAARARLLLAAGGAEEEAEEIMRGRAPGIARHAGTAVTQRCNGSTAISAVLRP